jgi:hypothetical protein
MDPYSGDFPLLSKDSCKFLILLHFHITYTDKSYSAICLVLQMIPLPETPRFLIEKNRNTEAAAVLARIKGPHATIDDPDIVRVRQQIEASIELESAGGPFNYKELLEGGRSQNFRRIVLCCAVNIMQQFTGSNMINYYAPVGKIIPLFLYSEFN